MRTEVSTTDREQLAAIAAWDIEEEHVESPAQSEKTLSA